MTVIVTGRTYEHRKTLIAMGGWFSRERHRWEFDYLSKTDIQTLKSLVGLLVLEPFNEPDDDRLPEPPQEPILIGNDFTYHGWFKDDPGIFAGFSSLGDFIDFIETLERPDNQNGTCDVGWHTSNRYNVYAGTTSLDHALEIARSGWTDALGLDKHVLPPKPKRKRRQRTVAGGSVNVGRMLTGVPDHMVRRIAQPGRKTITIFIETVMWEGISVNSALIRVAAITAIIDRLEHEGYSCTIVAVYCAWRQDYAFASQLAVVIKEAGERLNIMDISFAFGHPSFGRRLVYAHHGVIEKYGMNAIVRGKINEAFDERHQPPRNHFYIPQIRSNLDNVWKMIKLIAPKGLPIKLEKE